MIGLKISYLSYIDQMATTTPPPNLHTSCRKMTAYAWAKYYESNNSRLRADHRHYTTTQQLIPVLPPHIMTQFEDMAKELKKTWECPICMDMIQPDNLDITNCGHFFCKPCLTQHKVANATNCMCPVCRRAIRTR